MTTPTLDQVLHDARALPRKERARLVTTIVEELAEQPIATGAQTPSTDGLARFLAVAAEIGTLYPDADISGRIEADRREREASLSGKRD